MSTIKRTIKVRELIAPDGQVVKATLKWSNDEYAAKAGRSYYLVLGKKLHFPNKVEGITSDELAKQWAGIFVRSLGYKFK